MAREHTTNSFGQFLGTAGEVGKYAGTILAYLVAVLKLSPQYPNMISMITVVVTTVWVWSWRWQYINWSSFPNPSAYSKSRQWTERLVLCIISISSLLIILDSAPKAYEEVSGLECVYAKDTSAPRIIISRFHTVSGAEFAFENQVFSELSSQLDGQVTACLYIHPLKNIKDAEEAGHDLNGTIIIWGVSDPDYYQVHIYPAGWGGLELNWKAQPEYARDLRAWVVEYVTQVAKIQIEFLNGGNEMDVRAMSTAIDKAQMAKWAVEDPEQFAPAFFLTALMFEETDEVEAAIQAYGRAIESDASYDQAYLNRGVLYQKTDQVELARADYEYLIHVNSNYIADAYANRATLQTDWQKMKQDLLKAIELKPRAPEYYHLLGYSAIIALDVPTATNAYIDLLPHLDVESSSVFIEDLRNLAKDPSMQDAEHQKLLRSSIELLKNAQAK